MLRGDLATTPLDEVLRLLADDRATGRLALTESEDAAQARTADIYLAAGEVYAAWLVEPDADPALAADARLHRRLLAEAVLPEDAWADAIAAQEELFDWSVGELLVELGHLERVTLERVATEELLDAVSQAYGWRFGSYRFRRRERTRNRAGRRYGVPDLLGAVSTRRAELERLEVPPDAVPAMGDGSAVAGLEAAVLGLVDGVRSVEEIRAASGCTELEVAQLLRSLSDRGCVVLPQPAAAAVLPEAAGAAVDDPLSRWSALLDSALPPAVPEQEPRSTVELVRSDLPPRPVENVDPETAERRARLRARAAEELLAAQAEAEALREAAVSRAALADELSVTEEIRVFEDAIGITPIDAAQPSPVPEPIEAVTPIEATETKAQVEDGIQVEAEVPIEVEIQVEAEAQIEAQIEAVEATESIEVAESIELAESVEPVEVAHTVVAVEAVEAAPEINADPVMAVPDEAEPVAADEHDPALAAVLLRELSSLGLEQEPVPAATRTPRVPVPRQAAPSNRKKRGIFGR